MKLSRRSRLFFLVALLAVIAVPASAQIVFTVSATAQTTEMGYTSGNAYTFTFTLNNYAPTSPIGSTASGRYLWYQILDSHPVIWSTVTGDGLLGTWTTIPAEDNITNDIAARASDSQTSSQGSLELNGGTEDSVPLGLTVNGQNLSEIQSKFYVAQDFFDTSGGGSLPNPTDYFSAYLGSPAIYSDQQNSYLTLIDAIGNSITFTPTSLTISAVPEPSTYALFAGLAVLTGVVWHRRRIRTLVHHKS